MSNQKPTQRGLNRLIFATHGSQEHTSLAQGTAAHTPPQSQANEERGAREPRKERKGGEEAGAPVSTAERANLCFSKPSNKSSTSGRELNLDLETILKRERGAQPRASHNTSAASHKKEGQART
jgi:hypothetical protein